MTQYDLHVATQGEESPRLRAELEERGFTDDRLLRKVLDYPPFFPGRGVPPVIGLHMSRKGESSFADIRREMNELRELFDFYDQVGYAHAEAAVARTAFTPKGPYRPSAPWPLERLDPRFREEEKQWDLHIAVPLDSLPPALEDVLQYENSGFDALDRIKVRDGRDERTRIYTVQGVCDLQEGRNLFQAVARWFGGAYTPARLKLEVTSDMFRVGNPSIVPPTVDNIQYRE